MISNWSQEYIILVRGCSSNNLYILRIKINKLYHFFSSRYDLFFVFRIAIYIFDFVFQVSTQNIYFLHFILETGYITYYIIYYYIVYILKLDTLLDLMKYSFLTWKSPYKYYTNIGSEPNSYSPVNPGYEKKSGLNFPKNLYNRFHRL